MLAGLLRASIGAALLIPLLLLARRRRLLRPGMQYALWLVVALRLPLSRSLFTTNSSASTV